MKLLIIRHAPAGDRNRFAKTGRPDALRPLTKKGREKMERSARGLKLIAPAPEVLAFSPLVRARQTAEIVGKVFKKAKKIETAVLSPDASPEDLVDWLSGRREGVLALVGHEPHLGRCIAFLCTGSQGPMIELRKGQACLLDWNSKEKAAKILWSLKPSHLRRSRC